MDSADDERHELHGAATVEVDVDYDFGNDGSWTAALTTSTDGRHRVHLAAAGGALIVDAVAVHLLALADRWNRAIDVNHYLEGDRRAFDAVAACEGFEHSVTRRVQPTPHGSAGSPAQAAVQPRLTPGTRMGSATERER